MARFAGFVALTLVAGLAGSGCGSTTRPSAPIAPGTAGASASAGPGVTGSASAGPSPAAVPPSPGPSVAGGPAPVDDPPGLLTCRALAAAIRDASLMQPGVIPAIVDVSGTADAPVADAAARLAEAYRKAVASQGTAGEPDAVAAVSAAAADMSQVCADSGFAATN
ncbi:hypothetical protein ACTOB_001000 [Actinoplanes oblitus]|uniref:DUF732 domain-containing protein n=1 Tax=Actinoplanes oblitus TaxID=3040509 RepID=A0ABY8WHX1_9ACTN|nr:hypothetical protein [Actinoplanes oblitus]WIM97474.1 hypothetical protein ACTOB_001000 [Actinoplanes oblitus]